MIKIYAGRIQTQVQNGITSEYVQTFYEFVIPHILTKNLYQQISGFADNNLYAYANCDINIPPSATPGGVDVLPSNLIEIYRHAFGMADSATNISTLQDTTLNFFSSPSIDSKLNFECRCLYARDSGVYNGSAGFLFGDFKRNIVLKADVGNINRISDGEGGYYFRSLALLQNDLYGGNTIDSLLDSVKQVEKTYFLNHLYMNYLCIPQFAPLYFYYNDTPHNLLTPMYRSMGYNMSYGQYMSKVCSWSNNLSRWGNWYTMLKGTYCYGTPYTIPLTTPINGIEAIELGVCYNPHGPLDEGIEYTTTYNETSSYREYNGDYETHGFSYYIAGTDLSALFDTFITTVQQLYLPSGYIERSATYDVIKYSLNSAGKKIDILQGKNTSEFWGKARSFNRDGQGQGICLYVNNAFAEVPVKYWIRDIAENIGNWDYDTAPIFFGMYCYDVPFQSSYVDYETLTPDSHPVPGLGCNFTSGKVNKNNVLVGPETNTDYEFWETFLSGFNGEGNGVNIGGGSIGGGTSGSGGGGGAFNDSSSSIGGIGDLVNTNQSSILSGVGGIMNAYVCDSSAIASLGRQCWSTNWDLTNITKYFGNNNNPMDCLIAIKYAPLSLPRGVDTQGQIHICGQTMSLTSTSINVLRNEIIYVNFGSLDIQEYYGSFVDYDETKISIVLPYVGIQALETREIMGGNIKLEGYIDVMDSSITYFLTLNKNNIRNVINSWRGVCLFEFPLTGRDVSAKIQALIAGGVSSAANVVSGAASGLLLGGGVGAVVGGLGGAVSGAVNAGANYLSQRPSISRAGTFAGDRTTINKAYLIIERPKLSLPENYAHLYGYPSNITTKLKYLDGYTVVSEVHLENMAQATDSEVQEIDTLLKSGVIL